MNLSVTIGRSTDEPLDIKVTKIGHRWHARLTDAAGVVLDEMACELRCDISFICFTMLRWQAKGGRDSRMAAASRKRGNRTLDSGASRGPSGKIYYRHALDRRVSLKAEKSLGHE